MTKDINVQQISSFIRNLFGTYEDIPLHSPHFFGNEKKFVEQTLQSTFVSSVGSFVDKFENQIQKMTGSKKVVATVNGTAALHSALYISGVKPNDLVITQPLTFVATCNVLHHMAAAPIFCDISPISLGLCPISVENYLIENCEVNEDGCFHKTTQQMISAIVPMHTFGHPVQLDELSAISKNWKIALVEDAAESLGSYYKDRHTGTIADFSALSFNGNKIITTGGGGAVLCNDFFWGERVKHITSTSKVPHKFEFFHDEPGFNYRMPNINAALGCGQIENISIFLKNKRNLASEYENFFNQSVFKFVKEPHYAKSNYWLNAVICPDQSIRQHLLEKTNELGINTRPAWKLMHNLPMFSNAMRGDLTVCEKLEPLILNLPSSPSSN